MLRCPRARTRVCVNVYGCRIDFATNCVFILMHTCMFGFMSECACVCLLCMCVIFWLFGKRNFRIYEGFKVWGKGGLGVQI